MACAADDVLIPGPTVIRHTENENFNVVTSATTSPGECTTTRLCARLLLLLPLLDIHVFLIMGFSCCF